MAPTPLSRTSSASSVASESTSTLPDDSTVVPSTPSTGHTSDGGNSTKRTRKRFTNPQIIALEQVFHQTSHPTREQREAVASATGLELRSVTVWFQNKRQTERKNLLCYGPNFGKEPDDPPVVFPMAHGTSAARPPSLTSNASYQRSIRHSIHAHRPQLSSQRRPSLDSVASRCERPQARPKTPTRLRTYSSPDPNHLGGTSSTSALWENMPSSPLGPSSPEQERDRELVDFGKGGRTKRTLEWACAAARISGRRDEDDDEDDTIRVDPRASTSGGADPRGQHGMSGFIVGSGHANMEALDFGGDTEDESEAHEAITPNSSQSLVRISSGTTWPPAPQHKHARVKVFTARKEETAEVVIRTKTHDEETVNAALVLCGLGKR
ncbi:homeobox-domain-containing protein [Cristinia sonorae]|uniref:Homeobox-domain-containing protein n=1 Tax=Cristinia sonorae TaxID=1940300 RepID=A0A8K0XNG6_9AGAR|nr:homeobox-domain-containing protein [Cristinia sonorae]